MAMPLDDPTEVLLAADRLPPTARDRECERLAQALIDSGTVPAWEVPADGVDRAVGICADMYWRRRHLAVPSVTTARDCAEWVWRQVHPAAREAVCERWALGYAFITRNTVDSASDLASATATLVIDAGTPFVPYFCLLYHSGKLRTNFAPHELLLVLDQSPLAVAAAAYTTAPVITALRAFAAFLTGDDAAALGHLDTAWDHPERTRATIDICLHGIWAARSGLRHGPLLRDRAVQAVAAYPRDAVFHARLAAGLRLVGAHEAALDTIDQALRLLPAHGARSSHNLLQDQLLRERELIVAGHTLTASISGQQPSPDGEPAGLIHRYQVFLAVTVIVGIAAVCTAGGGALLLTAGELSLPKRMAGAFMLMLSAGVIVSLLLVGNRMLRTDHKGEPEDD
ncbi:putative membrane protein [Candidatus Protofrankia californiensis]|uniref:Putative membrane protein n=1 Tax=Candidatus Protofrankia californiensis TaxID=1839754 RepID=A0A1C3PDV2_9ACTN|nr:putative membrane protein [Candidatus Protofrankia californiensis]